MSSRNVVRIAGENSPQEDSRQEDLGSGVRHKVVSAHGQAELGLAMADALADILRDEVRAEARAAR